MAKRANILNNSFWYGLETVGDLAIGLLTSIAIARVIGPEQLGHYVYLVYLTNVAGRLGGFGTAAAARKYISEYLASDQRGLARAVFFQSLRIQTLLAVVIPLIGIATLFAVGDPDQYVVGSLLIAAIGPSFIGAIPALANVAAENFSRNVAGALIGLLAYAVTVTLALVFGWGLPGLAFAVLLRRSLETAIRLNDALKWMRTLPKIELPKSLTRKLLTFSGQALGVTVLTLVVWDRCELVFLKHFSDVRQLAFYSVAFSLSEYMLMLPRVVGGATGAALMTAYGRSPMSAGPIAADAIRRLAIVILPVHIGLAAISPAAVKLLYGSAYESAIAVLAIAALLSIPKAIYWLPQAIMQAADKQTTTLRWLGVAAVVNLALDAALIPSFGAVGAMIGNGLAQGFGVAALTVYSARVCNIEMPWRAVFRVLVCTLAMVPAVIAITLFCPPPVAVPAGIIAGTLIYLVGLRLAGVMQQDDADVLRRLGRKLPAPLRTAFTQVIQSMAPRPVLKPSLVSVLTDDGIAHREHVGTR